MPIEELKGIGAKKGELFRKLGVSSIGELICYYPRSYEDWSNTVNISQVQEGEEVLRVSILPPQEGQISDSVLILV